MGTGRRAHRSSSCNCHDCPPALGRARSKSPHSSTISAVISTTRGQPRSGRLGLVNMLGEARPGGIRAQTKSHHIRTEAARHEGEPLWTRTTRGPPELQSSTDEQERDMGIPESATEYASGRGHKEWPLLHPTYAPGSRIPCTDFSPWLKSRLAAGDREAIVAYVLQIVEANPGFGVELHENIENRAAGWTNVPASSPMWATTWIEETLDVLALSFDGLTSQSRDWEIDLRVALIMLMPLNSPLSILALNQRPSVLAAMMSVHDIRLTDPESVVTAVNERVESERRRGYPIYFEDVALEELKPVADDSSIPSLVKKLPHGSRSHLLDLASQTRCNGPNDSRVFSTYYATRQAGCSDADSRLSLIEAGLLRTVDDPEIAWQVKAASLTVAQLKDLLTVAGIPFPKSAKKASFIERARDIAELVEQAAEGVDAVMELTRDGQMAAEWMKGRVDSTLAMWAAWGALNEREQD